jgi:GxxExxY protein
MDLNEISYKVRGAIFEVYNTLGPGLLEKVYVSALTYELSKQHLKIETEVFLPVNYKGAKLDIGFRMDIVVEDMIIIEVKSVETLHELHKKQTQTYLKISGKKLAILVNFNTNFLKDKENLIRIIN